MPKLDISQGKTFFSNRRNAMNTERKSTLLEKLFEPVIETPASELGQYDQSTQTWSHRNGKLMSPVKHNQEH
ncbi:MAG: hypothetical protein COV96_00310 [Candidatus Zambryskibacteria bacterium CG11_big_fil_rev_8_21_14_0_20_42_18]|uniref:Uncharacterized protein n=1 Tax=Candidatus Zambryskibacteria bacterium CG_4_9_14_3_um_filter_42_15 TaxID=1975112 RepID=A0A2M7WRE1_9BACT|nr:MAG: hypothetical protein COV96_00310 [Candidatus Zambryskibacteria bacterium CG11_big_fil_rev_8_21_14_0_20_42_18]PJA32570.1 MAG: hypothetical protein CO185_02515 [Candidatus Zambryskibacteria bacterium CG_4_9_14_3_um_filter_42_15]